MQKQIFEDKATMHQAYLAGGILEIERIYRARMVDFATLAAWQQVDAGRRANASALLASGNRTLLWREQGDIIDRFYVQMLRHRTPEGPVVTYLMTLAGAPSVPGAQIVSRGVPAHVRGPIAAGGDQRQDGAGARKHRRVRQPV